MVQPHLEIAENPDELADRVAHWLAREIAATNGRFALNLSGGSTPKRLYERLAGPAYRDQIDWSRMHLFWGDERYVPADDKDSNYRMANEAMILRVPIPKPQVHRMPTDTGDPAADAAAYQRTLQEFYGAPRLERGRPLFDVTLLGIGEDGHTASLFPGTAVLQEATAWVSAVIGAKPEPRLTMTYPALEASRHILFLAAGADKRPILTRAMAGDAALPSARLVGNPATTIFGDRAALG